MMLSSAFWWAKQAMARQLVPLRSEHGLLISRAQLKAAMPYVKDADVDRYLDPLNRTLVRYHIDTPMRIAHLISQLGHESGSFRYKEEIADGSQYEGRLSLGNAYPGDGKKFKGRGAIQLTGRANYSEYGDDIGINLQESPERVATDPLLYIDVAGWYWNKHNLNKYADRDDIKTITKLINGGTNGLMDRRMRVAAAKKVFSIT